MRDLTLEKNIIALQGMNRRYSITERDWAGVLELIPDALVRDNAVWHLPEGKLDMYMGICNELFAGREPFGWANVMLSFGGFSHHIDNVLARGDRDRAMTVIGRFADVSHGLSWQWAYRALCEIDASSPTGEPSIIAMRDGVKPVLDLVREFKEESFPYLSHVRKLGYETVRKSVLNGIDTTLMLSVAGRR